MTTTTGATGWGDVEHPYHEAVAQVRASGATHFEHIVDNVWRVWGPIPDGAGWRWRWFSQNRFSGGWVASDWDPRTVDRQPVGLIALDKER